MSDVSDTATRSLHDQVAEEIRVIFVRKKLSQAEVARRLGWSQFYLSHRLTGKTPINVNDLEALADLLGVEPTTFFPQRSLGGGDINLSKCAQSALDLPLLATRIPETLAAVA
jgi:transcriptional regulator with XRE-family HTH domain